MSDVSGPPPAWQPVEYVIETFDPSVSLDDIVARLNELGTEGWQIVAAQGMPGQERLLWLWRYA